MSGANASPTGRSHQEMSSDDYCRLGMDRPITRRDFVNGVAVAITGASAAFRNLEALASQAPASSDSNYPPLRQGLRGNIPSAVDIFNPITAGKYAQFPVPEADIREEYDLVIVGAGISGLAAAHFYRSG